MPMSPDRRGHSRGPPRGPPPPPGSGRGGPPSYKVLCVSDLHSKASDDVVRDTLYREYKKYGDISVRVMHEPNERVAYVYFRNFEDARDAKHSKSRIILFDKPAMVEPVYERGGGGGGDYNRPRRSVTPPMPQVHDSRYRSRSPGYEGGHNPHHNPHHRSGGGPPRDYRDDYHHNNRDNYHSNHRDSYDRGHHHSNRGGGRPYNNDRGHSRGGHYHDDHHKPHHHHQPHHGHRGGYNKHNDHGNHHGHHGGGGGHHHNNRPETNTVPTQNKKDKFPNYLNHIPPEDDPLATRTLFTGNLELNITEEEMKRIFGRYGTLVDIDIKRPPPGTGNAYAFIRYENLDQAHRAKLELSGQYIGKFQCKIGYGKVNATPKVWVGGCGNWTSVGLLEREFDRFGAIQKIDYRKGDPYAFIWYETIEAAQAAVQEMRGFPLGGPEHRLRMDFADIDPPSSSSSSNERRGDDYNDYNNRGRGGGGGRGGYHRPSSSRSSYGGRSDDWGPGGANKRQYDDQQRDSDRPSRMRRVGDSPGSSPRPHHHHHDSMSSDHLDDLDDRRMETEDVRSVAELTKKTPKVWDGGLILKNSLFPTKLHLIEGSPEIAAESLKDVESDKPHLKITQRLRLDQGKLDDVTKRMNTASSHAVFLGVSTNVEVTHENTEIQSRPLRNLVSYLKQKEAAGVISLGGDANAGVLYCFPPCQFSLDLLRREIPGIIDDGLKEEHLVIVVVCGNN